MQPFVDITVSPSYGTDSCFVRWRLLPGFSSGRVYVYRSDDGQTGWQILNPSNPVSGTSGFEDKTFVIRDLLSSPHYRLLLEHAGQEYDSPVVGIFEKLNRREFAIVRNILRLELKAMREGRQGVELRLCSPKTSGKVCRCVDPSTKQSSQSSLCPFCYGTRFEGGFSPPITTWMRFIDANPMAKVDDPSGKHRSDQNTYTARALTFPELVTDDLVIHTPTDTRMAVVSSEVECFRGLIPVVCTTQLAVLPRQDIRYRLPLS